MKNATNGFCGEYVFLSNFYPCKIKAWGLEFNSVEILFQASKCANEEDRLKFVNFSAEESGKAKRLGRKIKLRSNWEDVKLSYMRHLLELKFKNEDLKSMLISTGDEELIEYNYWNDTFYGVCNGVGSNHLGKLLMELRTNLINQINLEKFLDDNND